MDPNEIIKRAPELLTGGAEIVKTGAAVAGALKFTDIIKAMLGPATAEIAERFRDEIRRYRYGRQLECLKKAEQMAKEAGFRPKAVPIKLLFPLLEGASPEENEDLHTMWAALLANAASPTNAEKVRPGFIAILKQMAPDEALALRLMAQSTVAWRELLAEARTGEARHYTEVESSLQSFPGKLREGLKRVDGKGPDLDSRVATCEMLLSNMDLVEAGFRGTTPLGEAFLECCEPPKPTS